MQPCLLQAKVEILSVVSDVPLWKEIVMLGFAFNVQGSYCIHTVFKAPGAQDSTG